MSATFQLEGETFVVANHSDHSSRLLTDKDAAKSSRSMKAMLGMSKLDINALRKAHENG